MHNTVTPVHMFCMENHLQHCLPCPFEPLDAVTWIGCCPVELLLVIHVDVLESVVCNFDKASKASGKFGGVAGVFDGVITYNKIDYKFSSV